VRPGCRVPEQTGNAGLGDENKVGMQAVSATGRSMLLSPSSTGGGGINLPLSCAVR
jgi:hypothetical protein